jgi:SAM-dependent methyltransferase
MTAVPKLIGGLALVTGALLVAVTLHPDLGRRFPRLPKAPDPGWEAKKAVIFDATPRDIVDSMLTLAEVKPGDVVYDLGSGDGRIVITAAKKYGVRAVGFEIDPALLKQSRESIRTEGVEKLAEIRDQDLFTVDLSPASVLTMYLLSQINLTLRPRILEQLKPGSRVVSRRWHMGNWQPERTIVMGTDTLYLWRIPARP